ncbi:MAG: AraC family transcriptional regulator [Desulfobacter sp.]
MKSSGNTARETIRETTSETTRFLKVPELGNLELLHACYTGQRFSPHFHEGHVIGVIERGHLGFDYRGEKLVASRGQINLADPGEVHNGFAASEAGWQYRMFYLAQGQLERIASEDARGSDMPFFRRGVIRDNRLARKLVRLHEDFHDPSVSMLEKESRFYTVVHQAVRRHTANPAVPGGLPRQGQEKKRISIVRAYIEDLYDTSITLDDLSRISQMSKYYLLRMFSAQTGLTPHAYLSHVRAARAKEMMDKGLSLAEVSLAAGFFDQSHLNRIFKRIYGITPGLYCRAGRRG